MIKARSDSIAAVRKRIERLPKLTGDALESYAKKNALALVRLFHDGIKKDQLGLWPLKDRTIATKAAAGFEEPESPLYGAGDEEPDRSYSNMLEATRGTKAWFVRPKSGYHWSKKGRKRIKLADLFSIHEYGATIMNGFGKGIIIRIPPRPALTYAYKKLLGKLKREEPSKKVREAMVKHAKGAEDFARNKAVSRMGGYP